MKVYVATDGPSYEVKEIKFCCGEMAEDILFGRVKTARIGRPLYFYVKGAKGERYDLTYCGHCGAKIEEVYFD